MCFLCAAAVADGLRCYVCNSKADIRCADPIQAAEESGDDRDDDSNINNNNNKNRKSNSYNSYHQQDRDEGLQVVDCKVAHNVRQAMDAVCDSVPF